MKSSQLAVAILLTQVASYSHDASDANNNPKGLEGQTAGLKDHTRYTQGAPPNLPVNSWIRGYQHLKTWQHLDYHKKFMAKNDLL